MINPIIYTIRLGTWQIPIRWYGLIVVTAIAIGAFLVERELKRRGEKSDSIWDALIWVVIAGIVGARFWYVLNATLGGNTYFLTHPLDIINIPQGGLHIFGAFLFGAIALLRYLRQNKLDPWLFLDAIGPAALIGQGIGRLANFINQELYGPPTSLPWGIPIQAEHRIGPYQDLSQFPVATTRFHPTFAYEMLWNFIMAGVLLWLSRRYEKQLKPGTIFAGWLLAAGIGRTWIELFFRTDQPLIPGTGISYSAVFSALMAIAGAVLLLARYKVIQPAFAENWEEEYRIRNKPETVGAVGAAEEPVEENTDPVKRTTRRTPVRRTTSAPRGTRRAERTKKST